MIVKKITRIFEKDGEKVRYKVYEKMKYNVKVI